MIDFEKYFRINNDFTLNQIEYRSIDTHDSPDATNFVCKDNLEVLRKDGERIDLLFTRNLYFEPSYLYEIRVSANFSIEYIQNNKSEVDWSQIDLIEEIKNDQNMVLGRIISKISLLISEITSCSRFIPVITPPSFMS